MIAVRIRETDYLFVDVANFRRYFDENILRWAGEKAAINYEALAKNQRLEEGIFLRLHRRPKKAWGNRRGL
jgi:hypothetical protein